MKEENTPAPAMGEELPALPAAWRGFQLNEGWNTYEQVTSNAIGSGGVISAFTADQMHAYGRACMALCQPAAVDASRTSHGKVHAKIELLHFHSSDVRLQIFDEHGAHETRMHGDTARFVVEAVAAANRAAPVSQPAPALLYTCVGKGGEYELIGTAKGAGAVSKLDNMRVYRSTKGNGQLYFRTRDDFDARMARIAAPSAPVGGA